MQKLELRRLTCQLNSLSVEFAFRGNSHAGFITELIADKRQSHQTIISLNYLANSICQSGCSCIRAVVQSCSRARRLSSRVMVNNHWLSYPGYTIGVLPDYTLIMYVALWNSFQSSRRSSWRSIASLNRIPDYGIIIMHLHHKPNWIS